MRTICILALILAIGAVDAAAEPDLKGKTVLMVIGFAPGGGTDAAGRLIAGNLGRHLPGQPHVTVQNVPGADGASALNYFVQRSKSDGLMITMGSGSQVDPLHYRKPQAMYDPTSFAYIGGAGRGGTALVINKQAEARLFDKTAAPVVMGSLSGMPRSGMQAAAWGKEFLGWNLKWVLGYRGTNDLSVALERGEIDMTSTGSVPLIAKLVDTGKVKVLAQSGTMENGKLVPRAEFGDAPVLPVLLEGKIQNTIAARSFEYWAALNSLDKWLALPPNTPQPLVDAYREGYAKMAADAQFVERRSTIADDFALIPHEEVKAWVQKLASIPAEAIDYIPVMLRGQGIQAD